MSIGYWIGNILGYATQAVIVFLVAWYLYRRWKKRHESG